MSEYKVVYVGEGGEEEEREHASTVFTKGKEYNVVGGVIHGWSTEFVIEGIPGNWNSGLFNACFDVFCSWDCLSHDYGVPVDYKQIS